LRNIAIKIRGLAMGAARSRLAIFGVLGGVLFALSPRPPLRSHIVISRSQIEALRAIRAAAARRAASPLSHDEDLVARAVDDEVLYREALRIGLDRNDPVMRRHLIEKMLLLAEDLGGASRNPSEAELHAYFAESPTRWAMPEFFRLKQTFFRDRAKAQATLTATHGGISEAEDAFPLPHDVAISAGQVEAAFGANFLEGLRGLAAGARGVVPSRYGWHLVQGVDRVPAHTPVFAEARARVALDYARDRRAQAIRVYLDRAREHYKIEIEGGNRVPEPEVRIAKRLAPSIED
jgi:peptidyl-prolyl cis-trans isomerase C